MMLKKIFFLLLLSFIQFCPCRAQEAIVIRDRDKGEVNRKIFGTNMLAYDPSTYEKWAHNYAGYSDYGAGIWDAQAKKFVPQPIELAKEAGITLLRFPGGCGAHRYDWTKCVGKDRQSFLYGLDEFLLTCSQLGIDAIITLSEYAGNGSDMSDLASYVKKTLGNDMESASKRRLKVYYEVGNESWHGDNRLIRNMSPEKYGQLYLRYYRAIKSVDPAASIGVALGEEQWNRRVLQMIGGNCDFGIVHLYAKSYLPKQEFLKASAGEIFSRIFSAAAGRKGRLNKTSVTLEEVCGRKIPLAVTEYNAMFPESKNTAWRHSLGAALLNAELIAMFLDPENNVELAAQWQYMNSYWGMIANGFDGTRKTLYNPYYKRPTYYCFQLYHEHFGDILLDSSVSTVDQATGVASQGSLSVIASRDRQRSKIYLMVLNKSALENKSAAIKIEGFRAKPRINAWVLNGPALEATNEVKHDDVAVRYKEYAVSGKEFVFDFEPHSLTALEIEGGYPEGGLN